MKKDMTDNDVDKQIEHLADLVWQVKANLYTYMSYHHKLLYELNMNDGARLKLQENDKKFKKHIG